MHFSWIFIVIVGVIILTFFVGFAVKYKDIQEKKTEIVILNNLDTALTNLQGSSFTTSTSIDLLLDINVDCSKGDFSIFINQKNGVNHLLASKNKLKDKMHIWYQPYEIPFKAANFYYLIDDSEIKVNSNFYDEIAGNMPASFSGRIVRNSNGINIEGDVNEGTVNGAKYIGKEMMYAAIFSSNYGCFYEGVKKKIDETLLIYQTKAAILNRGGCNYNIILSKLNMLRDFDNVRYSTVEDIERANRELASSGCPVLF